MPNPSASLTKSGFVKSTPKCSPNFLSCFHTIIVWKQDKKFGEHFGVDFTNPDFVKLAEGFGMPAWHCESADDFAQRLTHALGLDVPSLIVLPIDYSLDVAISEELGAETVAT